MTAHEAQANVEDDVVTTALMQAITEIRKRKPAKTAATKDKDKDEDEESTPKKDPVLQLADELEDVLRRYVAEKAIPPGTAS